MCECISEHECISERDCLWVCIYECLCVSVHVFLCLSICTCLCEQSLVVSCALIHVPLSGFPSKGLGMQQCLCEFWFFVKYQL